MTIAIAGALLAGSLATAPDAANAAGAGSILYEKGGRLWLAKPDGSKRRAVPRSKRLENPSQDDRGRIVAQRGINLHRLARGGRRLNRPFTTPFRTSALLPAFKGPFWPEVSPDGRTIAYTYSFTASRFDYGCSCFVVSPSLNTSFTRSDRFTDWPQRTVGLSRMYSKASWIDSRRVLMTTESLYDFAGNVLDQIAIDTVGGGENSYDRWFSECAPCDSLQTLQLRPLDEGEMTRARDRMVFVSGPHGTRDVGSEMIVHELSARMPPGIPQRFCRLTGATGGFTSPTWSPDGRSLAWADDRGVWVGRVNGLGQETCDVSSRLVLAGAKSPDWGPAAP